MAVRRAGFLALALFAALAGTALCAVEEEEGVWVCAHPSPTSLPHPKHATMSHHQP